MLASDVCISVAWQLAGHWSQCTSEQRRKSRSNRASALKGCLPSRGKVASQLSPPALGQRSPTATAHNHSLVTFISAELLHVHVYLVIIRYYHPTCTSHQSCFYFPFFPHSSINHLEHSPFLYLFITNPKFFLKSSQNSLLPICLQQPLMINPALLIHSH